jgi:hypothetical protein
MDTTMEQFQTIDLAQLEDITGALDLGRVFNRGVEDAGYYGTVGTLGGAAAGSVVPGVGTLAGAGGGGLIGAGVGFLWGAGRELYNQVSGNGQQPQPARR